MSETVWASLHLDTEGVPGCIVRFASTSLSQIHVVN